MLQDQSRNRTPMPGAQAPAAAPPDTGPARAEAGIATMLTKPEPEFVRVSQAAMIEALSSDVSAAVRAAIEDHAHALKAGEYEPDQSDEAFERHSARQNETDEHLRSVRCQSLSDLRAKLTYLIPISRPDLLDQRVGDHLEGLLADVDALSQAQFARGSTHSDPIFAAIKECERLEAVCTAKCAEPSGADGNCTPAQTTTIKAVWQHINGSLSETVPTTAAGCVALARFIPPLFDRWGASLDGEQAGKLFRLIERSPAHQPEHSENLEADAELMEIGRQWPGLLAAHLEGDRRLAAIEELDEEPQRPKELNVYSFDHLNGFPRTEDWGNRSAPYGAEQINELRAVPRVAVYVATPRGGFRREDGTFVNINEAAQRRAESIIEAWDRWKAEITAYEAKHDLPALHAVCREATAAYDAAILKARSLPAKTADGLLVKARIAAEICGPETKADKDDALDEKAILKSILADLLKIGVAIATPTAPPAPASINAPLRTAEIGLAHMVVDYFGNEDIDPVLNCDIALRDRARAILAAATSDATPDPIFAALAEAQRLDAVWHAITDEWKLDAQEPRELEVRRGAALEAFWDHWRDVVLKTVPTTAAGCSALSRYVVEYLDRDEVDLNEGPEGVNHDVLRLIMRSPMLPVGQPEMVAGA